MSFWKTVLRWFRGEDDPEVDYYREGVHLMRQGDYHDAMISFRLALRQSPRDPATLQQMAIAYTRMGVTDEAIKVYRQVLERNPRTPGAHYGLAFLLVRQGETEEAVDHLRAFLREPPSGPEADRHISHARRTLAELTGEMVGGEPANG